MIYYDPILTVTGAINRLWAGEAVSVMSGEETQGAGVNWVSTITLGEVYILLIFPTLWCYPTSSINNLFIGLIK